MGCMVKQSPVHCDKRETRQTITMKKLYRAFTDHPESVGESYFEHMAMAFGFGAKMIVSGLACLMHGLFPFLFLKTGSNTVTALHTSMVSHRDRRTPHTGAPIAGQTEKSA